MDVLHNKAPATLLKRCNSVSRLVSDLHRPGNRFPCSENDLYEHLCRQRDAGAPCSRLKSLLGAVTFVRHMVGVESLDICTKSRRCLGVVTPEQMNVINQAPPLKVEHMLAVHHGLDTDEDDCNVCFAGRVIFCVYGRARWGDTQHSQDTEWDMDLDGQICFVECSTAVHETCRALSMGHSFLPLTAPGPPSTKEESDWLKVLMSRKREALSLSESMRYTLHSFKCTTLSILAKYGCSFEDRLALGYHVDQVRMALRYSRDGASRPLRVLETCLADIRAGRFRPDITRSGRFVGTSEPSKVAETADVAEEVQVKQEVLVASLGVFDEGEVIDVSSDHATTCSESSSDDDVWSCRRTR